MIKMPQPQPNCQPIRYCCTVSFNATNGCIKCTVMGEYDKKGRHMTFPRIDCPRRTNDSFRKCADPDHHKHPTPLLKLPIDLVEDIIIADSLHLLDLGDAEKVKNLIRLRAELSPLFTGKRNASKYAWTVVEQELNVPLPLSKIIKKWNNLLQEYKAIKLSEEPKRREWPFFTLMDLYFSDQVNDPTLRLFSSTKTFCDTIDDKEDYSLTTALATVAAAQNNALSGGSLLDMSDLKSEIKSDQNETDLCDESKYCHNNNNNNNSNLNNNNNNNSTNNNNNNDSNVNNNNNNISSSNNNQNTNNNNRNSNNSSNNNNNNNNSSSNYGQAKSIQSQHSHLDYDDVASDYGNDLDNSSTNDILNRANEHHNIAQYLLSWNNFHGNMCKGFHNLQKDGQMVDVTIAAGGKIFKAHKLVLSVCSPYFQKIFLENPSTHPILFMTDVNSNYMAGLLDFMYSGQVNVKYDDLPSFLKVAEAMQIKGLHTESTKDEQEEKEQTGSTSLFQSQLQQQQIQRDQIHQQLQQQAAHQQQHQRTSTPILMSNKNRVQQPPTKYIQSPKHTSSPYRQGLQEQSYMQLQTLNLSQNRNLNKDLQTKSMLNEDIDSHSVNNSSNNPSQISNNSSNNNLNNNNSSKYVIQQTNISNKLLDNQKYPKYYSKRKLLAQYEQEMRNQKRCRPTMLQEDVNRNYKQTLNLINNNNNNNDDPIDTTTNEQKSGLITNIKLEPDRLSLQSDNVNNNSSNNNNNTDDDNNNNNNKNNNNSNYFNSNNNNNNDSADNNIHTFSTLKQQQQPPHSNHDSNDGLNLKTTPDQPKLNPSSIKSSS